MDDLVLQYKKKLDELCIFDIDSTLAHVMHRDHLLPFKNKSSDWPTYAKACVRDTPIAGAITLLNLLGNHYGTYLLSGRDGSARAETMWWLSKHGAKYDFLKLREPGDVDDNGLYKAAHIAALKAEGYKVHLLIDDWPDTVNTVSAAGTPALCVNPMYKDKAMEGYSAALKEAK